MNDVGIFNLSQTTLTDQEKLVLNHGLKFAPPKPLNKFGVFMDIQKYIRKLNSKCHLISNPIVTCRSEDDGIRHSGLANASLFNPPGILAPFIGDFQGSGNEGSRFFERQEGKVRY